MATNSDKKLTTHTSAVTVVTAEVMNALYGGEYAHNLALYAEDPYHPLVSGHVHDGEHVDGHASKVDLTGGAHVRGTLSHANLGGTGDTTPAVQKDNIECYSESAYGPHGDGNAIPAYTGESPNRCYYLDLSMVVGGSDTHVQYNKNGEFAGDSGFTYDDGTPGRLDLKSSDNEAGLYITEYADSYQGPDLVFSKARGMSSVADGDNLGTIRAQAWDGNSWEYYASSAIQFRVDGTPGDDDIPGEVRIQTRPAGVPIMDWDAHTRVIIKNDGKVGIGVLAPSAKLDVDGSGVFSGDLSIGGKLTVAGLIDPTGLILEEEEPTDEKMPTGPGKGAVFVAKAGSEDENEAPLEENKLYYKDKDGSITKLGGGGEPSLPDRAVQFNDNGTFAGDSSIIIDGDLNLGVGVTGNLEPARRLHVRDDRAGSPPPVRINDLTLGDGEYVVWEAATGDLYHKPLPARVVPGGGTGDLQWHDPSGGFGGNSDFTFDATQGHVGIGGVSAATPDEALEVYGAIHLSKEEPSPLPPPGTADGGVLWVDNSGELNYSGGNVQGTVTNVQPDWISTSGDDFIQNKPTTISSQQDADITTSVNHAVSSHAPSGATINSSDAVLQDRANHTGTQTAVTISDFAAEVSGNATVAANTSHIGSAHAPSGATINSSDAVLQDRANHTGTQTAVTISDFAAEVSGNATVAANTSHIGSAHAPSGATINSSDAVLQDRANHTGTQAASTISNFDTEVGNNAAVATNTGKVTHPGFGTTSSTCLVGDTVVGDINVQPDWNATGGDAFIQNQPTLPPANAEQNVQSDWNSTSGDTAIVNKPTIQLVSIDGHMSHNALGGSGFLSGDVITKGDNASGSFASSNGQDVYAYDGDTADLVSGSKIGIERGMMMSFFTATTATLIRAITFAVIEDDVTPGGYTDKYKMFIWKFSPAAGALNGDVVNVTDVDSNLGRNYIEINMASVSNTGYQEVTDSYNSSSSAQLAAGDKLIIGLEMVNGSPRYHDSFKFTVDINFEL